MSEQKTCSNGHALTPDNLTQSSLRKRCKACGRMSGRAYRDRMRKRGCEHGVTPASSCVECQLDIEARRALGGTGAPAAVESTEKALPTDYLRPTNEQAAALAAMDFAVDKKGRPLCEKPQFRKTGTGRRVQYFPHIDWVENDGTTSRPPSAVESMKMCVGCPVLIECGNVQKAFGYDGTWAGVSYINGKPADN